MNYIDDLFVYSKTFEEMVERLDIVLGRIISCGFKIKPEKSVIRKKEVQILGMIVTGSSIKVDPPKYTL